MQGGVEDGASLAARLDEAGLVGQHDGLDAVAEAELGQYPPDMDLDGSLGQVHLAGDLAVGQADGEPGEDGPFPVGEPAEQGIAVGLLAGVGEQGDELVDEPPGRGGGEDRLAAGRSNREIADQMHLSPGTVKIHVGRILAKLGLRDRVQAVVLAYESGLITPGSQ